MLCVGVGIPRITVQDPGSLGQTQPDAPPPYRVLPSPVVTDSQQLDPSDTRTPGQRRADALTRMCADHLAHGDSAVSGGFPPQVTITACYETLLGMLEATGCQTEDCGLLTPGIVRKILCDAEVIPVILGGESLPLDIGRAKRTAPWWLRRLLDIRDQGCVIPGCLSRPRYCDAHHVIHWLYGGPTNLDNLCLLCAHDHTLVHDGTIQLPDKYLETARRKPNRE